MSVPSVTDWLLSTQSLERIRRNINNRFGSRKTIIPAQEQHHTGSRHLSGISGRIGQHLEYAVVEALDHIADDWDYPVTVGLNVLTAYPDLWLRAPDLTVMAGIEVKAVYAHSVEGTATASWLVGQAGEQDLLLVMRWDWEPATADATRFPLLSDVFVGRARVHAQMRDAYWFRAVSRSDHMHKTARPDGLFFVRQGTGPSNVDLKVDEGNAGKAGRRAWIAPTSVDPEDRRRAGHLAEVLGSRLTIQRGASVPATGRVLRTAWDWQVEERASGGVGIHNVRTATTWESTLDEASAHELVKRLVPLDTLRSAHPQWPSDGLGTVVNQVQVWTPCGRCGDCRGGDPVSCTSPTMSYSPGTYEVDLLLSGEESITANTEPNPEPKPLEFSSALKAYILLPIATATSKARPYLPWSLRSSHARIRAAVDRDFDILVSAGSDAWAGFSVSPASVIPFVTHSSGETFDRASWEIQQRIDIADRQP